LPDRLQLCHVPWVHNIALFHASLRAIKERRKREKNEAWFLLAVRVRLENKGANL
jgi:hypothetical protein